jgi:formiminoglutamate deiminase
VSRALWCERAVLGGHLGAGLERGVLIGLGDRGEITEVRSGVASPPPGSEPLAGLVLPGFANAHSHAFHRALRGRTHGGTGDFWAWRTVMYDLAARLEPASYGELARAVFGEMVLAGWTAVGEFHYVHHRPDGSPYADANEMAFALLDAAADAGIRITLLDTCYLRGGVGRPLEGAQVRFSDGSALSWAARVAALGEAVARRGRPTERVGAAIHSVRAVDPESIALVGRVASARGAVLHAHVSEQPAENEQVLAAHGTTPVGVLDRAGVLGPSFTAVHATHLTPGDIGLLGATRSSCCFCPTTERDLADGIGPSVELSAAGASLCVGSDQHAVIDPLEEVRAVEADERLRSMRRGNHCVPALLAMGTAAGYRSLGWEGGVIAPGMAADLVVVSLDSPRLAGAEAADPLPTVLFGGGAADVDAVMVAGEWLARGGSHLRIDVARELRATISALMTASAAGGAP